MSSFIRKVTATASTSTADNPPPASHFEQFMGEEWERNGINSELYRGLSAGRVRQHVNPLTTHLQVPAQPPDWNATFSDTSKPLVLDIGCGYGRFLLALAQRMPTHNMLGLEIRDPVIERANAWAERLQLHKQVLFLSANATISVETILNTPSSSPPYPGLIDLVAIQFPDPHFKKKHKKRRTVQPNLILTLANIMKPGGRVFLQSDVVEVAEDMRNQFERHGGDAFTLCHELHNTTDEGCVFYQSSSSASREQQEEEETDDNNNSSSSSSNKNNKDDGDEWQSQWVGGGWLVRNPIEVPTEREVLNISQHKPVYRVMLVRN